MQSIMIPVEFLGHIKSKLTNQKTVYWLFINKIGKYYGMYEMSL